MHFGNVREKSVKIGTDRKLSKSSEYRPENVGCIPLAVVIITTANGMQLRLPEGIHSSLSVLIFTEYSRNLQEVHTDIARSILKSIILLLP